MLQICYFLPWMYSSENTNAQVNNWRTSFFLFPAFLSSIIAFIETEILFPRYNKVNFFKKCIIHSLLFQIYKKTI
jgi:hypothetical protein